MENKDTIFDVVKFDKWKLKYNTVKREFWGVLGVFVLITIILFNTCNKSEKTFETEFNKAIEKYEKVSNIKFYPYGKNCLEKKAKERGLTNESEIYDLILENEKWFKK